MKWLCLHLNIFWWIHLSATVYITKLWFESKTVINPLKILSVSLHTAISFQCDYRLTWLKWVYMYVLIWPVIWYYCWIHPSSYNYSHECKTFHWQDYHWWWKSFLMSGSCSVYVFLYAIFYFLTKVCTHTCS